MNKLKTLRKKGGRAHDYCTETAQFHLVKYKSTTLPCSKPSFMTSIIQTIQNKKAFVVKKKTQNHQSVFDMLLRLVRLSVQLKLQNTKLPIQTKEIPNYKRKQCK